MLVLIPAIFLFATSIVIGRYYKTGVRISLLVSAVLTGTVIAFMTEVLSLFHSFSFYPVIIGWLTVMMASIGSAWPVLKLNFKEKLWDSNKLFFDERFLLCFIELTLAITFLTALASTPNTWDSMTYHLARVEHWIQNRTIAYYPTHITRQLVYSPWAEYAFAHLRFLCPWENTVNLLQWFAMAGSLVGVSLIAQQWGLPAGPN